MPFANTFVSGFLVDDNNPNFSFLIFIPILYMRTEINETQND